MPHLFSSTAVACRAKIPQMTYTARDLAPFARDCGYSDPPFRWDEERRFRMRAELDALYFRFYGINREDAAYILDTFPIVRRKEESRWGEYRSKRLILEIYDAISAGAYRSPLDPPPGSSAGLTTYESA